MFKEFKYSLYDLFGYFLPGCIFASGLAIIFWAFFIPREHLLLYMGFSSEAIALLIVVAYLSGHLAHGLGNVLMKRTKAIDEVLSPKNSKTCIPETIIQNAEKRINKILDNSSPQISMVVERKWTYVLCSEVVSQCGSTSDQEIFTYREGFYRGMTISYVLFALALVVRTIIPGAVIELQKGMSEALRWEYTIFIAILSLGAAYFSYRRFERFSRYLIGEAVLGFIVVDNYIEALKNEPK